MNARLYDPRIGRFFSPDNFVSQPENSQSYNRYSYALNNPLKYTDPTGNYYYGSGGNFSEPFFPMTIPRYERPNFPRLRDFFNTTFDELDNIMNSTKPNYGGGGGGSEPKDPEKEEEKKEEEKDPEKKEEEKKEEKSEYPYIGKAKYDKWRQIKPNFEGDKGGMCMWLSLDQAYFNLFGEDSKYDLTKISNSEHSGAWNDGNLGSPARKPGSLPFEDKLASDFECIETSMGKEDLYIMADNLNDGYQLIMNYKAGSSWHAVLIHDITITSPGNFSIGYWDCEHTESIQYMNQNAFDNKVKSAVEGGIWGWSIKKK